MLKVGEDGKVKRREDGKILKPDGWRPPDIWAVLNNQHLAESMKQKKLGAEHW
jgi:predicted HAD superfamily Cof-like phosphohydrolase